MTWVSIFNQTLLKPTKGHIESVTLNNLKTTKLGVSVSSNTARLNWWLGIELVMLVQYPVQGFPLLEFHRKQIPLNANILVELPSYLPAYSYSLRLDVPYWMKDISIQIWKDDEAIELRHTRGKTPPNAVQVGEIFEEVDELNLLRYNWLWSFDGSEWVSPEMTLQEEINSQGITATTGLKFFVDSRFRYHLLDLEMRWRVSKSQTSTVNWTAELSKESTLNGVSKICELNTSGNSTELKTRVVLMNQLVDAKGEEIKFFELLFEPHGDLTQDAGTLYAGVKISYKLVRT
jgi:hypothetical protein